MKNISMKLATFLLLGWSVTVLAAPANWQFQVGSGKQNIATTTAVVNINKKDYLTKLTLMCTKDEKPYVEGALSLNMELPKVVADYFPMNDIEGPGAKVIVNAQVDVQLSKAKSYHATLPTSVWYGESSQVMFGIAEPHKAHQQFYQMLKYLANGASELQITLENPQSDKTNIVIKANTASSQAVFKRLMQGCDLR